MTHASAVEPYPPAPVTQMPECVIVAWCTSSTCPTELMVVAPGQPRRAKVCDRPWVWLSQAGSVADAPKMPGSRGSKMASPRGAVAMEMAGRRFDVAGPARG